MEYAIDVARACRARGVKSVAVTAGYICPEPRRELYHHMDAANVDLKGFTERFYHKVCGGHLTPVLDTLCYLKHETEVWFEITTLLIPGENDTDEELDAMTRWVVEHLGPEVPLHFTAFHPDWKMRDTPHTPATTLTARETHRARERGALRLHRERTRPGGGQHLLSRLRRGAGRARLVRALRLEPLRGRALLVLRDAMRRGVRAKTRSMGAETRAGTASGPTSVSQGIQQSPQPCVNTRSLRPAPRPQ